MSYKNTANQFGFSNTTDDQSGISIAFADDRYINETEGYKKKEINDLLKLKANTNETIQLKSGKVTSSIDMNGKRILNIGTPITNNDASTKGYVDSQFVRIDGGSQMTGELNMNNKQIINLREPTVNSDVVNKLYVDTLCNKKRNVDDSYSRHEVDQLFKSSLVNVLPILTSNTSDPNLIVTANQNSSTAYYVSDSNPETKWSSTETSSTFYIKFLGRSRKIVRILLEGDIPDIWTLSVSDKGSEWTRFSLQLITVNELNIVNPSFNFFYLLRFSGTVNIRKLELFERQTIVKDLEWPSESLQAVPKLYVDEGLKSLKSDMTKLGIKSLTGYIPTFDSIQKYESNGFNVVASSTLTISSPWNILFGNLTWVTPDIRNCYIEVQLPESIRIWKFALQGNKEKVFIEGKEETGRIKLIGVSGKRGQPESIILKGGIKGSTIYTDIFSTLDADLEPGLIKHFEVNYKLKFSIYRIHCNTSTAGSERVGLSHFQLYPVLDVSIA